MRPIVKNPHKILRTVAANIPLKNIPTPKIQGLLLDMKRALHASKDGVGLAAPQIGEPVRIFLVSEEAEYIDMRPVEKPTDEEIEERKKKQWNYFVYINPSVRKISKRKNRYPEGCLSVPGVFGFVPRPEKITVEAYDENGKKFTRGASRFFARVLQHELDHIDGVLFIDKVEKILDARDER